MNIHEALKAIKDGKAVRRPEYPDRIFLAFHCDAISEDTIILYIMNDDQFNAKNLFNGYRADENFSAEDIEAEDWEIITPKGKV